ncbi:MAG: pilus assembly protein PilP [Desulfofustis sp.]|jgi:type IV pilus assembly protein PilP
MNMIIRCDQHKKFVLTALIGLASFFLCHLCLAADAQENDQAAPEEIAPVEIKKRTTDYEYQVDNRPDPFAPFVSGQARENTVVPDEIIENNEVLTGMQLFEPGQLTLVALMLTGAEKLAMVQDSTGRGYVIEEGMKIGRRGVITAITDDRVLIEETARTRSGKVLKNEIAMVLKREGDK